MIPQASAFWTRDLHMEVGGLDTSLHYSMDYDLFLRMGALLAERPDAIRHVPDLWSVFRIHPNSKSVAHIPEFRREDEIVRARYGLGEIWTVRRWAMRAHQRMRAIWRFHRERGLIPTRNEPGKA